MLYKLPISQPKIHKVSPIFYGRFFTPDYNQYCNDIRTNQDQKWFLSDSIKSKERSI